VHRRQRPDIIAAASTATNLTITFATDTATATAARMEMNNWDDAEIRGVAGCVLYVGMQCCRNLKVAMGSQHLLA
jgi:hypothetical protein